MTTTRRPRWLRLRVWPWRRLCQIASLCVLLGLPIVARYHNYLSARQLDKLLERWEESPQGLALARTDEIFRIGLPDGEGGVATRRPRKAILERTKDWYGSPWSARIAGQTLTDPLAVAESWVASRSGTDVLWAGLLIPLVATLLLGRVYCSWICPGGLLFDVGAKIRSLLGFLEIKPGRARVPKATKYAVLAAGLGLVFWYGMPFLHSIYPPALMGREAYLLVGANFDRAEQGSLDLALEGLGAASVFLLALVAVEVFLAPGLWCRSLCPGGAIYSLLGKFRLVRIRRDIDRCDPCGLCNTACPRALMPMQDKTGMECDSCGLCIDVCPDRAIKFHVSLTSSGFSPTARKAAKEARRSA